MTHAHDPFDTLFRTAGLTLTVVAWSALFSACYDGPPPPAAPAVTVIPQEIDFGSIPVNELGTHSVTLEETGHDTGVVITGIDTGGEPIGAFSVQTSLPLTLPAGGTATIEVAFQPTSTGAQDTVILLRTEPAIDPAPWFRLAGTGTGTDTGDDAVTTRPSSGCEDGSVSPADVTPEICDGIDNDCDGLIDNDAQDAQTWYRDSDQDHYGAGDPIVTCDAPPDYVSNDDDCDDTNGSIHPGAPELCDGIDNDCDGNTDDNAQDAATWYADNDGDGHGSASETQEDCAQPAEYVMTADDCDDADPATYPGATEVCNLKDDDCDGSVDEDAAGAPTWYADADRDGHGEPSDAVVQCSATDRTLVGDDCDDTDPAISPDAQETCDGIDNDCDGLIDEDLTVYTLYPDGDGDGYGKTVKPLETCTFVEGYVTRDGDCDDTNPAVSPGAAETCNHIDDDCDGRIDEDLPVQRYYPDQDNDGYGATSGGIDACDPPTGYVTQDGDCDDLNTMVHPNAHEMCNLEDDDCDGEIDEDPYMAPLYFPDHDGDGFGGSPATSGCSLPQGYVTTSGDCDDDLSTVYPGAEEVCNDVDDDCNGVIDDNAVDQTVYAADFDGDGFGAGEQTSACTPPTADYVPVTGDVTDCNDADPTTYPGASELCDGVDHNCDGIWSLAQCTGCHVSDGTVPALYHHIQDALDDAATGTEFGGVIRVCPGTYQENLVFSGAPVILRGSGATQTIISGDLCTRGYDQCSTITFEDGEMDASGLLSLTIQGGTGNVVRNDDGTDVRMGGGVLIRHASPSLVDVRLVRNEAEMGGGIAIAGGSPALSNLDIHDNFARINGGGLAAIDSAATISNCTFADNSAGQGGGLYLETPDAMTITESDIESNLSTGSGGGMATLGGEVSLNHVDFLENETVQGPGGGASFDGTAISFFYGNISSNYAGSAEAGHGGALGLFATSNTLMVYLEISGNMADGNGGGIYGLDASNLSVNQSSIADNVADGMGGGIFLEATAGKPGGSLATTLVENNEATQGGGAFLDSTALQLMLSEFIANRAIETGGGLGADHGTVEISNTFFLVNEAGETGGALWLRATPGQVYNNTLVKNSAPEGGSGIALTADQSYRPTFQNNIVSHGDSSAILGSEASNSAFGYNDIYPDQIDGVTPDETNLSADPRFMTDVASSDADPLEWDLHLRTDSPCIDAGNPDAYYDDADGSRNDLGAYGGAVASW